MSARRLVPLLAVSLMAAGPPPPDADWPCIQRQVPTLTAATLWAGHAGGTDWRQDPAVAALIERIAPRARPVEQSTAALTAFIDTLPPPERPAKIDRLFAGLVEETNAQRTHIIAHLLDLSRRQRDLTKTVATVTTQLRALPPDTPEADREEITTRRAFLIRDFESVGRTVRYACEAPVQLEARLGLFAQTLQKASGGTDGPSSNVPAK